MPFLGGTTYQEHPKKAYEAKRKTIGPHPTPKLTPYEPTWSERIGGKMADWVTQGNVSNVGRQHWGEKYTQGLEFTPVPAVEGAIEGAQSDDWSRVAQSVPELIPQEKALGVGAKLGGVFVSPMLKADSGLWNAVQRAFGKGGYGNEGLALQDKARQMLKSGYSEADVLKETGISYGRSSDVMKPTVIPQVEISGRDMLFNPDLPINEMTDINDWKKVIADPERLKNAPKVGDIIQWPGFYNYNKALGDIQNKPIFLETDPFASGSMFSLPGEKSYRGMSINPRAWGKGGQAYEYGKTEMVPQASTVDLVGHEFGHIPQRLLQPFKWSKGANPEELTELENMPPGFFFGNEKLIEGLQGRFSRNPNPYIQRLGEQAYLDTVGETQARIGASRMAFDEPTMRSVLPEETGMIQGWASRNEQIPVEMLKTYIQSWQKLPPAHQALLLQALGPGGPTP